MDQRQIIVIVDAHHFDYELPHACRGKRLEHNILELPFFDGHVLKHEFVFESEHLGIEEFFLGHEAVD